MNPCRHELFLVVVAGVVGSVDYIRIKDIEFYIYI